MACRGMVLLADTWFAGWQATVDGESAKLYHANAVIRGVVAEAGTHTIEMRYRPRSVMLGAVLSLLALGLAGFVYFRRGAA